ncbi:hypothetical protein OCGS_1344 [Oceaniovalibus guishaninsula JLT2003]|uniref:Uncharacterized protein n=1 Tax=Oceaniovalibus guishaninsula JLT2003 TaxID=1231392 RepID=K2GP93_9RHOB|nr:hypothetical protein OCGS_1344 [Oceaniovalibus guishaninsula JLT2003]
MDRAAFYAAMMTEPLHRRALRRAFAQRPCPRGRDLVRHPR